MYHVSSVLRRGRGSGLKWVRKVGAQVLFRFKEVAALEVVTDKVHVLSRLRLVRTRCRGAWLRSCIDYRVLKVVLDTLR